MKIPKVKKFNKPSSTTVEQYYEVFDEEEESSTKRWFDEIAADPNEFPQVTEGVLIELKDEAHKCHTAEVSSHNIKNSKTNPKYKWMKDILSKGTVSDKLAAYTVLVQDNPIYNIDTLRNMIGLVKAGKKKECLTAIQNLTELFLNDLLRPNQKLKSFYLRPLSLVSKLSSGNSVTRKKILCYWYFEDQLKELYTSFILALNNVAHDTVDANKEKAIGAMFKLLAGNPEQEKNLLMHVVNKLGDPSQKVASKAIYCLTQLLRKHSNMQGVVLTEVEKLLFRPNVSTRSQYYGICFLSQYILSHEDSDVAKRLIEVYFAFFKACVKKGEVDSRMMSALLMGVNRAYPYAKMQLDQNSEHIQTMYRVVHIANFNVSLHALSLLYQVSDFANNINDRFYSALYKKLIDIKILKTTHQAMLLNLIYKALMKDTEPNRIKTFIKRLLQIAMYVQPNFSCGILFLISQVINKKERVEALEFIKTNVEEFDDDDGEEKYVDVKEEPLDDDQKDKQNKTTSPQTTNGHEKIDLDESNVENVINLDEIDIKPDIERGWYHRGSNVKKEHKTQIGFRPLSRNPLYAGGEYCTYIELNNLKNHYHPTVSLFATQLLDGETISYTGDPLKDFTLIRFLDRFVFKNPKKKEDISKLGAHPTFGKRKQYIPVGLRSLSVTSENYLNEKEYNIPAEERFMYMYLQKRRREKAEREDDDSDLDSVASEEFEELLDKMGGKNIDEEDDDDELDFNEDVEEHIKINKKKKKKKGADDASSDEEMRDDDDFEDIDNDDDFEDLGSDIETLDEDDDDLNFEDDDDLGDDDLEDDPFIDVEDDTMNSKKQNKKNKKMAKARESDFAPAEEFAALLEDEGASTFKPGSANTFVNKDKSAVKQITWEDKRNQWVKGYRKGGNKRPQHQKHGNNKKFKKS